MQLITIKAVATGCFEEVLGKIRIVKNKNDIPTGFIPDCILVLAGSDFELDRSAGLSNAGAIICNTPRAVWKNALRLAKKGKWKKWLKTVALVEMAIRLIHWISSHILRMNYARGVNLSKIVCLFEDCLSQLQEGMVVQIKVMKKQIGELTIILPAGEPTKGRENA